MAIASSSSIPLPEVAAHNPDFERFRTTTRAFRPLPVRDGELLFASDLAGHPQVFRLPGPGRWPIRVATTIERMLPVVETAFGLLVRHDRGGNETWQLSLVDSSGCVRPLTRDTKAIHTSVTLSPDGKRIGLAYNPNGQIDFVLGVIDLETGETQDWLRREGVWRWLAWHPDGKLAAVQHVSSPTRTETFLIERGAEPCRLFPAARRTGDVVWTAAGSLYAVTDLESEFLGLVELDARHPDRPKRWLIRQEADVEGFVPNRAGSRAVVVLNAGTYDSPSILDLGGGEQEALAGLPQGVVYQDMTTDVSDHIAWSLDDASVFISWETPDQPADIYELPAGKRWTLAGGLETPALIRPQLMSYQSFDGLEISALFYRIDDQPRPAVVYFHGGPERQMRGNYQPVFHLLNMAGINVFAPNVRGSTGYGIRFFSLDDKALRWNAVRDGCAAARYLKQANLATRVAAMGRSDGGFMTLAVLVEDPDLWDAAVEFVGIADWRSFFKNTSGWRRAMRMAEYGDPEGAEAEVLRQMSPLGKAHRIKAPLLICHGRNDIRVPVS